MLNTMGRFIYTKYWVLLYVAHCGKIIYTKYLVILYFEQCGKIYLHKIQKNTLWWTLGIFIYTKYSGLLYIEHSGKIYLHKILGITFCWTLWEDLFTQNTEEYWMLFTQNTGDYFMLSTVGKFIYAKYWGLLYVEHCGKIYLHKILWNTVCGTLWEDLFTQNTEV